MYLCIRNLKNKVNEINKIVQAIDKAGLKRGHVAKQIGISEVHLSYVLNGERALTDEVKNKLKSLLKIN